MAHRRVVPLPKPPRGERAGDQFHKRADIDLNPNNDEYAQNPDIWAMDPETTAQGLRVRHRDDKYSDIARERVQIKKIRTLDEQLEAYEHNNREDEHFGDMVRQIEEQRDRARRDFNRLVVRNAQNRIARWEESGEEVARQKDVATHADREAWVQFIDAAYVAQGHPSAAGMTDAEKAQRYRRFKRDARVNYTDGQVLTRLGQTDIALPPDYQLKFKSSDDFIARNIQDEEFSGEDLNHLAL